MQTWNVGGGIRLWSRLALISAVLGFFPVAQAQSSPPLALGMPETRTAKWFLAPQSRAIDAAFSPEVFSFWDGDRKHPKFGLMNSSGQILLPARFDGIRPFAPDRLIVEMGKVSGIVDLSGKFIVPLQGGDLLSFTSKLATIYRGKRVGFIDRDGKSVMAPRLEDVASPLDESGRYSDVGVSKFVENGKTGLMDQDLRVLIPAVYDELVIHGQVRFYFRQGDKWGMLDGQTYAVIVPARYDAFSSFFGEYSSNGGTADPDDNRYAKFLQAKKMGLIDQAGREVLPARYDEVGSVTRATDGTDVVQIRLGDKWGLLALSGAIGGETRPILKPTYKSMDPFNEGRAAVYSESDKCGYIDLGGSLVIPMLYDRAEAFYGDWAQVTVGEKRGLVDRSGREVLPARYWEIVVMKRDARIYVRENDKGNWTILDRSMREIVIPGTESGIKDLSTYPSHLTSFTTRDGKILVVDMDTQRPVLTLDASEYPKAYSLQRGWSYPSPQCGSSLWVVKTREGLHGLIEIAPNLFNDYGPCSL